MELLLLWIFFHLYAITDAWHDHLIMFKKKYWHSLDALIKLMVVTLLVHLSSTNHIIPDDGYTVTGVIMSGLAVRWFLFDLCYNLLHPTTHWSYVEDHGINGFLKKHIGVYWKWVFSFFLYFISWGIFFFLK